MFFKIAFLASIFALINSEILYKWQKSDVLPEVSRKSWRATSFALNGEQVFFSLIDVEKPVSGNGVVAMFNKSEYILFFTIFFLEKKIITVIGETTDEVVKLFIYNCELKKLKIKEKTF